MDQDKIGEPVQGDLPDNPWRTMDRAPKNSLWVEVKIEATQQVYRAHFAQDLSGEEQPPFRGWFIASKNGRSFIEIAEPYAWRPISWVKVDQEKYIQILPRFKDCRFFQHFPGIYCKKCGAVYALYSYSGMPIAGDDENNRPFYNGCLACCDQTLRDYVQPELTE